MVKKFKIVYLILRQIKEYLKDKTTWPYQPSLSISHSHFSLQNTVEQVYYYKKFLAALSDGIGPSNFAPEFFSTILHDLSLGEQNIFKNPHFADTLMNVLRQKESNSMVGCFL